MAWRQIGTSHYWTNADPIHWRIYVALWGDEIIELWLEPTRSNICVTFAMYIDGLAQDCNSFSALLHLLGMFCLYKVGLMLSRVD